MSAGEIKILFCARKASNRATEVVWFLCEFTINLTESVLHCVMKCPVSKPIASLYLSVCSSCQQYLMTDHNPSSPYIGSVGPTSLCPIVRTRSNHEACLTIDKSLTTVEACYGLTAWSSSNRSRDRYKKGRRCLMHFIVCCVCFAYLFYLILWTDLTCSR